MSGIKLTQTVTHTIRDDEFHPYNYHWSHLGEVSIGVSNDEGYSKIYLSLGTEKDEYCAPILFVEVTEKFYYTNSNSSHHQEIEYYEFNGNLKNYIHKHMRGKINGKKYK